MANSEHTIKEALELGQLTLETNEAYILLQHTTHQSKEYLYAHPEVVLSQQEFQTYKNFLARRDAGEPIAYIIEQKEFWSLKFKMTPGVLIPRPETELIVETSLQKINEHNYKNILDLGTGSGCIAIALAKECPELNIVATDISATCINIAQENMSSLGANNITFIRSHWFSAINNNKFDLIISNPPYIAEDDKDLEANVEKYEPDIALLSENNGLADLYQIVENSYHYLNENGTLIVEHGYTQSEAVRNHFKQQGYLNIISKNDLQDHERVTLGNI